MKMTRDVRWLDQQIAARLGAAGVTVTTTQILALAAVKELPGANQGQLTAATMIDRSTLSDVLRRLGASGYVVRADNPQDARAFSVDLTAAGRKLLKVAAPKLLKVESSLLVEAKALIAKW